MPPVSPNVYQVITGKNITLLGINSTRASRRGLLEEAINKVGLDAIRDHDGPIFLVSWHGSPVPRGIKLHGNIVANVQNGDVRNPRGESFATYERISHFAGETKRLHEIIIFMNVARQKEIAWSH